MPLPYLSDYVPWRLRSIYETATNGHWELVGKTAGYRDEETGEWVIGRRVRGGWSDEVPELPERFSPKITAAALRRGAGVRYRAIVQAVRSYGIRHGLARFSRKKRPSVAPHRALTKKCLVCGVPHTKKQHKFHGVHSFHRSHMFAFNPMKNPRSPLPLLYGRVLRVEAQKTQKHVCDSGCREVHHRYYHDFTSSPDMLGLPAGSQLVLPDGSVYKLGERSLLITKSLRRSR